MARASLREPLETFAAESMPSALMCKARPLARSTTLGKPARNRRVELGLIFDFREMGKPLLYPPLYTEGFSTS
jgi:hypothetical protein